jgi:hypothetical protein
MIIEAPETETGLIQTFNMFCVSLRLSGSACALYTVYHIKLSIISFKKRNHFWDDLQNALIPGASVFENWLIVGQQSTINAWLQ